MTDDYFINFQDRTYDDLYEAADSLEESEVSDERSVKIYLLRELAEMYRLRLVVSSLTNEQTDLMPQYDLLSFFGGGNAEENSEKLRFLKSRLNRLWNLDTEARAQHHLGKFNFKSLQTK